MPATVFAARLEDVPGAVELVGGPPVVLKPLEGMRGSGVELAESVEEAVELVSRREGVEQRVLVQELVRESRGVDVRVLVIGGRVVAALRRREADPLHSDAGGEADVLARYARATAKVSVSRLNQAGELMLGREAREGARVGRIDPDTDPPTG